LRRRLRRPTAPGLALQDRLDTALDLYNNNKVSLFLVSGDHGTKDYDEVNTMKQYLLDHDIPKEKIFLDHAGFDTYDSFYRARDIFEVTSTIVVTQGYHLPRSIFIGNKLGITTYGVNAERTWFPWFSVREVGALRRVIFLSKLFFVKKVSSDGLVVFLSRKTSLRLSIPYEHEAVHVLWGHRNIKSGIVRFRFLYFCAPKRDTTY
jgi:vancomycin permeability regulator SanA